MRILAALPMKLIPLVWAMLWRRKTRTALTFASIAIAFMLFGLLQAFHTLFASGARFASADVLLTGHRYGFIPTLPYAYRRQIEAMDGVRSVVTARLESEASFQACKDAITGNPRLSHTPQREADYFEAQGGVLAALMRGVGYVVAAIMAIGALFAALNTMYASVESRAVGIGTLRALGFGGAPVVASVLVESVVLCGAGSLAGGALAFLLFNGYTVSTVGANFSQVAFAFSVKLPMLIQGAGWACVIGLLGGFAPALRAARMPLVDALRAV